jgi:oligopeptide transport system ATP-binding protein
LALVANSCERAYVMYGGHIVETGATQALFANPVHPYTDGLMRAASAERDGCGRFVTIAGEVPDLGRPTKGCPFEPRCNRPVASCAEIMPNWSPGIRQGCHAARCWQPLKALS